MKKTLILILMVLITIIPQSIGNSDSSLKISEYNIDILNQNGKIYVEEKINFNGNSNEKLTDIDFWISNSAENIKIIYIKDEIELISNGNNNYSINLSSFNISKNSTISLKVQYYYNNNINEFRKFLSYNIDVLIINFNDVTIFSGFDLPSESSFLIPLYKPTEAPVSSYLFIAIFLIVLLVLLSIYYILRKLKSSKIKNISGESKELLSTKKLLLMSILKQLEKEYRAKKISSDTYNKLRDFYKQEAVDSMKKLEDIDSEII